jgi:hypothetical protein
VCKVMLYRSVDVVKFYLRLPISLGRHTHQQSEMVKA